METYKYFAIANDMLADITGIRLEVLNDKGNFNTIGEYQIYETYLLLFYFSFFNFLNRGQFWSWSCIKTFLFESLKASLIDNVYTTTQVLTLPPALTDTTTDSTDSETVIDQENNTTSNDKTKTRILKTVFTNNNNNINNVSESVLLMNNNQNVILN